jgi:hypothetical protein
MRFSYAAFHFTFVLVAVSACFSALVAVLLVASALVAISRCSVGHGLALHREY